LFTFKKDGTTVGSIGTQGGDLTIGTGDTGLRFSDSADSINPWDVSTNMGRGDSIDLANSNNRFKDLYLSGGVYLGGTGAANKLDDYEEGTWTPVLTDGTTSYNMTLGNYTRVGRLVTVSFSYGATLTGTPTTGNAYFTGLPFSLVAGNGKSVGSMHLRASVLNYNPPTDGQLCIVGNAASSSIDIIKMGAALDYVKNVPLNTIVAIGGTSNYIAISLTYMSA
jgi:hypothetical protein